MKKGRHRRYEEARAMKHTSVGSLEALIREHDSVDPELLAKWPEYASEEITVDLDQHSDEDSNASR
jgi:hypothetical protein